MNVAELKVLIEDLPDDMPLWVSAECGHVESEADVFVGERAYWGPRYKAMSETVLWFSE